VPGCFGVRQRSMNVDRDLHAVTLPPLGESKHMGALPPHTHHGAGDSRAPAPGVRKRCMARGLPADACPTWVFGQQEAVAVSRWAAGQEKDGIGLGYRGRASNS
jgi:hypothetical protein